MEATQHTQTRHPLDDGQGEYIIDPLSVAAMVSQLLQMILALVGPQKAKEALNYEILLAAHAAVDEAGFASDKKAEDILKAKGIV